MLASPGDSLSSLLTDRARSIDHFRGEAERHTGKAHVLLDVILHEHLAPCHPDRG